MLDAEDHTRDDRNETNQSLKLDALLHWMPCYLHTYIHTYTDGCMHAYNFPDGLQASVYLHAYNFPYRLQASASRKTGTEQVKISS